MANITDFDGSNLRYTLHDLIINHGVTANDRTVSQIFEHIVTDLYKEWPEFSEESTEEYVHEPSNYEFIVDKAAHAWRFNEARKLTGRACELHTYVTEDISLHLLKELAINLKEATDQDRIGAPDFVRDSDTLGAVGRTSDDLAEIIYAINEIEKLVKLINNRALLAMKTESQLFTF